MYITFGFASSVSFLRILLPRGYERNTNQTDELQRLKVHFSSARFGGSGRPVSTQIHAVSDHQKSILGGEQKGVEILLYSFTFRSFIIIIAGKGWWDDGTKQQAAVKRNLFL